MSSPPFAPFFLFSTCRTSAGAKDGAPSNGSCRFLVASLLGMTMGRDGALRAVLEAGDGGDGFVEDEKEVVDDDAGDGDVKPERERPASDGFVAMEAAAQGEVQSDEHERDDDGGENCMADKKREIRRANGALAGETDESGVIVEVKIRDEKTCGASDGGEHARLVLENFAAADKEISSAQKDGAGGVEKCVEARKRAKRNQ